MDGCDVDTVLTGWSLRVTFRWLLITILFRRQMLFNKLIGINNADIINPHSTQTTHFHLMLWRV